MPFPIHASGAPIIPGLYTWRYHFLYYCVTQKGDIVSFYLEVVPGYDLWFCQFLNIFVQVEANLKFNHWTN